MNRRLAESRRKIVPGASAVVGMAKGTKPSPKVWAMRGVASVERLEAISSPGMQRRTAGQRLSMHFLRIDPNRSIDNMTRLDRSINSVMQSPVAQPLIRGATCRRDRNARRDATD